MRRGRVHDRDKAADTTFVKQRRAEEQSWTFVKDGITLAVSRAETPEGFVLGIHGNDEPRSYAFAELPRLVAFQEDFETFLLATGWTFVSFSPDRRAGHERRHFSRLLNDRRRWWTDGMATPMASGQANAEAVARVRRPRGDRKG